MNFGCVFSCGGLIKNKMEIFFGFVFILPSLLALLSLFLLTLFAMTEVVNQSPKRSSEDFHAENALPRSENIRLGHESKEEHETEGVNQDLPSKMRKNNVVGEIIMKMKMKMKKKVSLQK